MIVRELLTRLSFTTNEAQLRRYETGVNNIKNSAEGAANSFRNMFAAFVGLSAAQSLGKTAETMMSMEARVGMLPQTIGEASDAFDTVGKRASSARQSIDAYGNLYIKLQNAGKDFIKTQEEGLQVTDTLSKALVVGGATAQEQSSAMLQFAQAIGSGVLQGDEMRAMAEAAPQFMDELAKAIGVPRSEIKKMGSDGKLTSKVIIEAVKKMSSVFDEKFKQMPMTISQAITIGQNRWAMFINKLNRKSGTVTSIANFLLDGFDKVEKKLGELVDWLGGASNAIKVFGIVIGAALTPLAGSLLVGAITALISPMTLVVGLLVALGFAIDDFYTWMRGGDSYFGDWLGNFDTVGERLRGIILIFKSLLAISVLVFAIWAVGWVASGAALTAFLANATVGIIGFGITWIIIHAQMAIAAIAAFWPFILLIGLLAVAIAAFFWFWDNFKDIMDLIYNLAIGNWDGVADAFYRMVEKLKGYWKSFKSFFGMGASTTIDAKTASGAAASAGGVQMSKPVWEKQDITIQQSFPAGTESQYMQMARQGALQGMNAVDNGPLARQMGQAQ